MMTYDDSQAIVRRLFDVGWNSGNPASVGDIIDKGYESNDGDFFRSGSDVPGGLERLTGVDAFAHHVQRYEEIYDDLHFAINRMILDGDTVITVWTATGIDKVRTFIDRAGRERHHTLNDQGVSFTGVADGKVTRHDMYWPGGLVRG
jgi:hypothetical protein